MNSMLDRAKDILNSKYLATIDKIPKHMPGQKKIVEFARDAALYIIEKDKQ